MSFDALADIVRGATFDDFLLRPQYSIITRRDPSVIDLSCRFSTNITLKRPLVSANMDTVTRAPMAIVQAEEGGIGIIDRGFRNGDIGPQVREVEKVKRMQHIIIRDPYAVDSRDAARRRGRRHETDEGGHARRRRWRARAEGPADRARRALRRHARRHGGVADDAGRVADHGTGRADAEGGRRNDGSAQGEEAAAGRRSAAR